MQRKIYNSGEKKNRKTLNVHKLLKGRKDSNKIPNVAIQKYITKKILFSLNDQLLFDS